MSGAFCADGVMAFTDIFLAGRTVPLGKQAFGGLWIKSFVPVALWYRLKATKVFRVRTRGKDHNARRTLI